MAEASPQRPLAAQPTSSLESGGFGTKPDDIDKALENVRNILRSVDSDTSEVDGIPIRSPTPQSQRVRRMTNTAVPTRLMQENQDGALNAFAWDDEGMEEGEFEEGNQQAGSTGLNESGGADGIEEGADTGLARREEQLDAGEMRQAGIAGREEQSGVPGAGVLDSGDGAVLAEEDEEAVYQRERKRKGKEKFVEGPVETIEKPHAAVQRPSPMTERERQTEAANDPPVVQPEMDGDGLENDNVDATEGVDLRAAAEGGVSAEEDTQVVEEGTKVEGGGSLLTGKGAIAAQGEGSRKRKARGQPDDVIDLTNDDEDAQQGRARRLAAKRARTQGVPKGATLVTLDDEDEPERKPQRAGDALRERGRSRERRQHMQGAGSRSREDRGGTQAAGTAGVAVTPGVYILRDGPRKFGGNQTPAEFVKNSVPKLEMLEKSTAGGGGSSEGKHSSGSKHLASSAERLQRLKAEKDDGGTGASPKKAAPSRGHQRARVPLFTHSANAWESDNAGHVVSGSGDSVGGVPAASERSEHPKANPRVTEASRSAVREICRPAASERGQPGSSKGSTQPEANPRVTEASGPSAVEGGQAASSRRSGQSEANPRVTRVSRPAVDEVSSPTFWQPGVETQRHAENETSGGEAAEEEPEPFVDFADETFPPVDEMNDVEEGDGMEERVETPEVRAGLKLPDDAPETASDVVRTEAGSLERPVAELSSGRVDGGGTSPVSPGTLPESIELFEQQTSDAPRGPELGMGASSPRVQRKVLSSPATKKGLAFSASPPGERSVMHSGRTIYKKKKQIGRSEYELSAVRAELAALGDRLIAAYAVRKTLSIRSRSLWEKVRTATTVDQLAAWLGWLPQNVVQQVQSLEAFWQPWKEQLDTCRDTLELRELVEELGRAARKAGALQEEHMPEGRAEPSADIPQPSTAPPSDQLRLPESSEPPSATGPDRPIAREASPDFSFRPDATSQGGEPFEAASPAARSSVERSAESAGFGGLGRGRRLFFYSGGNGVGSAGGGVGGSVAGKGPKKRSRIIEDTDSDDDGRFAGRGNESGGFPAGQRGNENGGILKDRKKVPAESDGEDSGTGGGGLGDAFQPVVRSEDDNPEAGKSGPIRRPKRKGRSDEGEVDQGAELAAARSEAIAYKSPPAGPKKTKITTKRGATFPSVAGNPNGISGGEGPSGAAGGSAISGQAARPPAGEKLRTGQREAEKAGRFVGRDGDEGVGPSGAAQSGHVAYEQVVSGQPPASQGGSLQGDPDPPLEVELFSADEPNVEVEVAAKRFAETTGFLYNFKNRYPQDGECQSAKCVNNPGETNLRNRCLCPPRTWIKWGEKCSCKKDGLEENGFGKGCVANRFLKRGALRKMRVFDTHSGRGLGVKALEVIEKDDVIAEKCGDVVHKYLYRARQRSYSNRGLGCYVTQLGESFYVLDQTNVGNVTRFMNHSCDGGNMNLVLVKCGSPDNPWGDSGPPGVLLRARRRIEIGEELTWDYNLVDANGQPLKSVPGNAGKLAACLCGASNCKGSML